MSSTRTTDVSWDVVTDILSRLPVKSLLRFYSVAKSFYALSKDPQFISRHLHGSNKGSPLLVHKDFGIYSGHFFSLLSLKTFDFAVDPNFPSPDGRVVVVGSCRGIVCLLCNQGPYIILWNPSIRERIILPAPLLPDSLILTMLETNFNSIGFGFHNGEYKVVRIVNDISYKVDLAKIEIYSTSLGLWREMNSKLPRKIKDLACSVIIKGTPYWIGYESDDLQKCIVSFDMASEVFEAINLPWWNNDISWKTCGVGTFNDHLAVYCHNDYYDEDEEGNCSIEIWVMNYQNCDEKWTKLFVIHNVSIPGSPVGLYDDGLFLWVKLAGCAYYPSTSPKMLLVYSVHTTKKVKSIFLEDLEDLKAYAHFNSLVRIDAGNKHS